MKSKLMVLVSTLVLSYSVTGKEINICSRGVIGDEIAKAVEADSCQKVSVEKMAALESLDIAGSNITTIGPNAFSGLVNLTTLDLSLNNINSISETAFQGLLSLDWLSLEGCHLKSLPENLFKGLTLLDELHLGDNPMAKIDRSLLGLSESVFIYQ